VFVLLSYFNEFSVKVMKVIVRHTTDIFLQNNPGLLAAAACYLCPKKRYILQVVNLTGNLRPVLGT